MGIIKKEQKATIRSQSPYKCVEHPMHIFRTPEFFAEKLYRHFQRHPKRATADKGDGKLKLLAHFIFMHDFN